MKARKEKNFEVKRMRFPVVFCKSIVENNGGLFVTFTDIETFEEYEHFQVMPGNIESGKAGKSKAETYLRRLARAADLDKDYCILDFTSTSHHRSFSPIEGRFFQLKVLEKQAIKGSAYEKTSKRYYKSAEEIWHFEGDGEFDLTRVFYVLSRKDKVNDNLLQQIAKLRAKQHFKPEEYLETDRLEAEVQKTFGLWKARIESDIEKRKLQERRDAGDLEAWKILTDKA